MPCSGFHILFLQVLYVKFFVFTITNGNHFFGNSEILMGLIYMFKPQLIDAINCILGRPLQVIIYYKK
jgi:hypothetical protein